MSVDINSSGSAVPHCKDSVVFAECSHHAVHGLELHPLHRTDLGHTWFPHILGEREVELRQKNFWTARVAHHHHVLCHRKEVLDTIRHFATWLFAKPHVKPRVEIGGNAAKTVCSDLDRGLECLHIGIVEFEVGRTRDGSELGLHLFEIAACVFVEEETSRCGACA